MSERSRATVVILAPPGNKTAHEIDEYLAKFVNPILCPERMLPGAEVSEAIRDIVQASNAAICIWSYHDYNDHRLLGAFLAEIETREKKDSSFLIIPIVAEMRDLDNLPEFLIKRVVMVEPQPGYLRKVAEALTPVMNRFNRNIAVSLKPDEHREEEVIAKARTYLVQLQGLEKQDKQGPDLLLRQIIILIALTLLGPPGVLSYLVYKGSVEPVWAAASLLLAFPAVLGLAIFYRIIVARASRDNLVRLGLLRDALSRALERYEFLREEEKSNNM